MIIIKNLRKKYKTKFALDNINLCFNNCGFISIAGESGSGKTTFLKCVSNQIKYEGSITFDNKDITSSRKKEKNLFANKYISFLTQDFSLSANLSVKENILLPFSLRKGLVSDEKIANILSKLNLDESYINQNIEELSQGERQRVALARVILNDSKVILCDEPTGNLDSVNSLEIYRILKELSKTKLVCVVSHNDILTNEFSDRIIKLNKGKVVEDKIINKTEDKKENFLTFDDHLQKPKLNFTLKMTKEIIFKKLPLSLILTFINAICFGFISSFLDIRSFDAANTTQNVMDNGPIKAIEISGLTKNDTNGLKTKYYLNSQELDEISNYFSENDVSFINLYSSYLLKDIFYGINETFYGSDLSSSYINQDILNEFNLKYYGRLPQNKEIMVSYDFLVKADVLDETLSYKDEYLNKLCNELTTSFNDQYGEKQTYKIVGIINNNDLMKNNIDLKQSNSTCELTNLILFNEEEFNSLSKTGFIKKDIVFSSNNNGYLKALNYRNSEGYGLQLENLVISERIQKESIVTVLSAFSVVILIFLIVIDLMIFFNYLYSQINLNKHNLVVLRNCGASNSFLLTLFIFALAFIVALSILVGVGFNEIINLVFNLMAKNVYIDTTFNIAFLMPFPILICTLALFIIASFGTFYVYKKISKN